MSDREKKLLTLFGLAALIIAIFFGFNFFQKTKMEVQQKRIAAEAELKQAQMYHSQHDAIVDEIEWLNKNEPKPKAEALVPSELQQFCATSAAAQSITIKNQKIEPGSHDNAEAAVLAAAKYRAARVQFTVTCREEPLYRWLSTVHSPNDFRVVHSLKLNPNREDDTQIDCVVTFEQWYIPQTPENTAP